MEPLPPPQSAKSAPLWSRRGLLFPTPLADAPPPMWNRPASHSPLFAVNEPSSAASLHPPMWDRPGCRSPIFIESVPGSPEMWARPHIIGPACPCCHPDVLPFEVPPPPPILESRPATRGRPQTSGGPSLKKKPSGISLRLKKSFQSLRRRRADDAS